MTTAGVLVAIKPRYAAYVVAAWLAGIIVNLLTYSGYCDVALRDFELMLGGVDARAACVDLRPARPAAPRTLEGRGPATG
jgi:hypothetical protein